MFFCSGVRVRVLLPQLVPATRHRLAFTFRNIVSVAYQFFPSRLCTRQSMRQAIIHPALTRALAASPRNVKTVFDNASVLYGAALILGIVDTFPYKGSGLMGYIVSVESTPSDGNDARVQKCVIGAFRLSYTLLSGGQAIEYFDIEQVRDMDFVHFTDGAFAELHRSQVRPNSCSHLHSNMSICLL